MRTTTDKKDPSAKKVTDLDKNPCPYALRIKGKELQMLQITELKFFFFTHKGSTKRERRMRRSIIPMTGYLVDILRSLTRTKIMMTVAVLASTSASDSLNLMTFSVISTKCSVTLTQCFATLE